MIDLLKWQLENFINPFNTIITVCGLLAIYSAFYIIYTLEKKEFVRLLDMKFSVFEKGLVKKWAQYIGWACIQQCIMLIPFYFIDLPDQWKYFLATIIFSSGFHFPNKRLMLFTFAFGGIFYGLWFFFNFQSIIYLAILHGFGGTCFYKLEWSMTSWVSYWKENK